jgi:hypothetical protein
MRVLLRYRGVCRVYMVAVPVLVTILAVASCGGSHDETSTIWSFPTGEVPLGPSGLNQAITQ